MKRICYILICLCFLSSLMILSAQETTDQSTTDQNTSDTSTNSSSADNDSSSTTTDSKSELDEMSVAERVLYIQALSTNRSTKLNLIQEMEKGNIPVDENALRALTILAGDGTAYRYYSGDSDVVINNADIRMRAVGLLGKIGTEDARKAILNTLNAEEDSMVMGAAFVALSTLAAPDDGGVQMNSINRAMRKDMISKANESLADDYLKTLEKLADSIKGDSETVEMLLSIVDSSYGYSTYSQKKAYSILRVIGA